MFYVFEAVPMLIAISVFCVWHPGAYFGAGKLRGGKDVIAPSASDSGEGGVAGSK